MAVRSHHLDVYDCWLHVTTDSRQIAALRRRYGVKKIPLLDKDHTMFGGTNRFRIQPDDGPEQTHYAIHLDAALHRGDRVSMLNTIAHEATHTACLVLDDMGADYDGNSEPLAYLVAWLTRWLWEATT